MFDIVLQIDGLVHVLDERPKDRFTLVIDRPLAVRSGSFTFIVGPSGCGKTTLLTLLGLLRNPFKSKGSKLQNFQIFGNSKQPGSPPTEHNIAELWNTWHGEKRIEKLRRELIGFALQHGELLRSLKVGENMTVPMRLQGYGAGECRNKARQLIRELIFDLRENKEKLLNVFRELATRYPSDARYHVFAEQIQCVETWEMMNHMIEKAVDITKNLQGCQSYLNDLKVNPEQFARKKVTDLSGGEYQRVALARAISHSPKVVFIDEPTSALDANNARKALTLLKNMSVSESMAVVMITHDTDLARRIAGSSDQFVVMTRDGDIGRIKNIGFINKTRQPTAPPPHRKQSEETFDAECC